LDNQNEDTVNLWDVLIVVVENIKLLVVGPVLVAVFAYGVGSMLPKKYESEAIILLASTNASASAQQAAAMMLSPIVLDPVIGQLNLAQGDSVQLARQEIAAKVKTIVGKDGLLRLKSTGNSPQEAQTLGNAIIESWLATTIPKKNDKEDLEIKLAYAKNGLKTVTSLLERLSSGSKDFLNQRLTQGEAGSGLVAVSELQSRYLNDSLSITRALKGVVKDDVLKQPPTLTTEPVAPKKSVIAIFAGLFAGLLLLVFVFLRNAWRNASQTPEVLQKKAQLAKALGVRR
jgi:uncharacterized protein involved in exopolysaccharide biosynthesis